MTDQFINPRLLLKQPGGETIFADLLRRRSGYVPNPEILRKISISIRCLENTLCEGYRGSGKTELAEAIAETFGIKIFSFPCGEEFKLEDVQYEWNEEAQKQFTARAFAKGMSEEQVNAQIYTDKFLIYGTVFDAFQTAATERQLVILLLDEIEKADPKFINWLLQTTARGYGDVPRRQPSPRIGFYREYPETEKYLYFPIVIATSNAEKPLSQPFRSRFSYIHFPLPTAREEIAILRAKCPFASREMLIQAATVLNEIRHIPTIVHKPGIRESIRLMNRLHFLGEKDITPESLHDHDGALINNAQDLFNFRTAVHGRLKAALKHPKSDIVEFVDDVLASDVQQTPAAQIHLQPTNQISAQPRTPPAPGIFRNDSLGNSSRLKLITSL